MIYLMLRLLSVFLLFGLAAFSRESPQQAAEKAEADWLALVDTGQYNQSWANAAELFKTSMSEAKWDDIISRLRKQTGPLKSRKLAAYTDILPDAPPGKYLVFQYNTSFVAGAFVETVTPMQEKDGTWKVSGYFVKPAQ